MADSNAMLHHYERCKLLALQARSIGARGSAVAHGGTIVHSVAACDVATLMAALQVHDSAATCSNAIL
jgi:hypothetical protein